MNDGCERIKCLYQSGADSILLLRSLFDIAGDIGLEPALSCLEQSVTEKRLNWIARRLETFKGSGNAVRDGFALFFEEYLGLSIPKHGEVIEISPEFMPKKIVVRWWNECPTLNACQQLGLDTRLVCKAVYHRPVTEMLKQIHPHLSFDRSYTAIRPYTPYCEEIIAIEH